MAPETGDVPFKDYLDSKVEEVRRAVDVAAASRDEGVPLRQYIEAVLREQQRALEIASGERDKAAEALRAEQTRALEMAAQEREKAAVVLRQALTEQIANGDTNLKAHVDQQIGQIREALLSAEKLEIARITAAESATAAVQREIRLTQDAADRAIQKAEEATEKRFAASNAYREQLAAQASTFLPREVAEAQFAEIRRTVAELAEKVSKLA